MSLWKKINIGIFLILFLGKSMVVLAEEVNDSTFLINQYTKGLNLIFSNPDSAILLLTSINPILENQQWNDKYIYSKIGLYLANKNKGDFESGLSQIEGLLEETKTLCGEDSKAFAFSANTLFYHYDEKGDYHNAFKMANTALGIFQKANSKEQNKLGIAVCLSNLGMMSQKLSNLEESLRYNLLALDKKKEILEPGNRELLKSYQNLAVLYEAMGNHQKALELLYIKKHELIHFPLVGHEKMIIDCINEISFIHLYLGNYDSVFFYLDLNENIQKKNGTNYYPQIKFDLLSQIKEKEGDFKEALFLRKRMHLERRIFFKNLPKHPKIAESYSSLASLYMQLDSFGLANNYLDSALMVFVHDFRKPTLYSLNYPIETIPILQKKAICLTKKTQNTQIGKDVVLAEYYFLLGDSLIQKVKTGVQNEQSKLLFSKKIHPFYESAISFFFKKGGKENFEKAFFFAEKSKASLLQFGLQDPAAKVNSGVPDSLIQQEKGLKIDIAFYENLIFKEEQKKEQKNIKKLTSWRSALIQKQDKRRRLLNELRTDYPHYHKLKYQEKIPSIEEIQKNLKNGELLIEFFYGKDNIYLFSITEKKFETFKITRDENFDTKLFQLLNELQKPSEDLDGYKRFIESACFFYQKLIKPVFDSKKNNTLIIIPDGLLSLVPVGVFLTEEVAKQDNYSATNFQRFYRRLPYLFQITSCEYEYSAKLFSRKIQNKNRANKKLLAYAPTYTGNLNLAFNKPQILGIMDVMRGNAFLGNSALKSHFLANGGAYNLIHFATHGFPDTLSPLRAHLLFFDSAGIYPDSSQLFAYDIYNMALNAQLVVLAACETAYGKIEQGEGVMSLGRAFRYAGCDGVISSLWKADGRSSNDIMFKFYQKLNCGMKISKSLNESKREFLKKAPSNQVHPHYWANFTFYGEDKAVSSSFNEWWILIFSILMITGSFYLYKRHYR